MVLGRGLSYIYIRPLNCFEINVAMHGLLDLRILVVIFLLFELQVLVFVM